MRLFVSLPLPPAVRAHLAARLAGVRTTDIAQWHLTLAFLGEVGDPTPLRPGLAAAAAAASPLRLQLRGGGSFPGVLWAAVAGDTVGLHALAADVASACRAAGVPLEDRPYRPHVTVARRRRDPRRLEGYEGPTWVAGGVHLVRSSLEKTARHQVLEVFPLGASTG